MFNFSKITVISFAILIYPTAAFSAEKLTVLLDWFVNPDHAPLVVALQTGMFKETGLDVTLVAPSDPSLPPKIVAAGKADIAKNYLMIWIMDVI